MGVVAGIWGRSVAPQAGVALAVGARGVACRATELRRAAAGADRTLAWEEPTSNCGITQGKSKLIKISRSSLQISYEHYSACSEMWKSMKLTLRVARLLAVCTVIWDVFMVAPAIKNNIRCYTMTNPT